MNKLLIKALVIVLVLLCLPRGVSAAILFGEDFETGLDGWTKSTANTSLLTTVPNQGRQGSSALAVKNIAGTNSVSASYLINNWGRISVYIRDDLSLLNDPTKDTFVFLSANTNGQSGDLSIGIRPKTSTSNYTYCPTSNFDLCMDSGVPRTNGYHQFKIFVTPKGSYGKIDGDSLSYLPTKYIDKNDRNSPSATSVLSDSTTFSKINLGITGAPISSFVYFDDVAIEDWPADSSNEKEINLAKKFVGLYLNNYSNIDPAQIIAGINNGSTNGIPWTNCNNNISCFENKLHGYFGLAHLAMGHAVNYKETGNQADLSKAIQILQAVVGNRNTAPWIESNVWARLSGSRVNWYLAMSVIMLDDELPQSLASNIKSVLTADANLFTGNFAGYNCYGANNIPPGCTNGDTSGENNGWAGTFLHFLSLAYPDDPNVSVWKDSARVYIFHTKTLGDTDPIKGVTTQTLWTNPAYYLENHNYLPHPGYTLGVVYASALAQKLEQLIQDTNPYPEFDHNVTETWLANRAFLDFSQFKMDTKNHPENHQGGEGDASSAWVSLTFFKVMKDMYPATNSVFGYNDLANHAYEYEYYIKDSYLAVPTNGSVSLTANDVSTQSSKFKNWVVNGFISTDPVTYLMIYDLDLFNQTDASPSPSPAAVPGDYTGDNQVNMDDYNLVISQYGTTYDIFDLNLVVTNFGS